MRRQLRIALLAPLIAPITQPFIGGAQAMLRDLAVGLAVRGHAVTLYAADRSDPALLGEAQLVTFGIDSAQLQPARFSEHAAPTPSAREEAPATDDEEAQPMNQAFSRAYDVIASQADQHDLLHAHAYDWAAFAYASRQPLPVLHTLHLPVGDRSIRNELTRLAPPQEAATSKTKAKNVWLATVSQASAAAYAPFCRIDAVVYNGIAVERIPFGAQPDPTGYLLYAGRITPEKGVEDALGIATRAERPLLLAGGVYDQAYFAERIAPRLDQAGERARYLGHVSRERLWQLMAGATATLCPSHWIEPFGLVACEALAAGSPVIAYAQGGLREVIEDGVTGTLVAPGDLDSAVEAIARIGEISRAACRDSMVERFSLARMLDDYEALYARMADG